MEGCWQQKLHITYVHPCKPCPKWLMPPLGCGWPVSCRVLRLPCTSAAPLLASLLRAGLSSTARESSVRRRALHHHCQVCSFSPANRSVEPPHYALPSAWAPATLLILAGEQLRISQLQGFGIAAMLYHWCMSDIVVGLWLIAYFHGLRGTLWVGFVFFFFFLWEMQVVWRQGCESPVSCAFFIFFFFPP